MPRKVRITKEKILEAALGLLIREGYDSVNINNIARELNCSTQPISWHFGNMEGLRKALVQAALEDINKRMVSEANNCINAFWNVGCAYINLAFDEPNLFRFIYMGESKLYDRGNVDSILTDKGNRALIEDMARYLNISIQVAGKLVQRMIIYVHGFVSLVVAGVFTSTKEEAYSLMYEFGKDLLLHSGTDLALLSGTEFDIESVMSGITISGE